MMISPIIVALDFPDAPTAVAFARRLDPKHVRVKVGKELFVAAGPAVVEQLQSLGFEVFLDLKFHDIPNTVANACVEAAKLGVWMTNVHASGGAKMMQAVTEKLVALPSRPLMIAVTVLTSTDEATLRAMGVTLSIAEQVTRLANLAKNNGLDGVVCSAQEAAILRQQLGKDFLLVTPGIRLTATNTDSKDDQHRIMTPSRAMSAGSDYLVIGRPITQADNPEQVVENILTTLQTSGE